MRARPAHVQPIPDLSQHAARFVSITAFASYLGVDRRQVLKWIRAGTLQAYRLSDRHWRIDRLGALAFLRRARFSAVADPDTIGHDRTRKPM